jgi:formate-dependent nitrite reductase membrane component NrfD
MTPQRAPYGRHDATTAGQGGPLVPYRGETYYDEPAVKPSPYGGLIIAYLFVGGVAGSSQLLATLADLAGRGRYRSLIRAGRYLGLAGALASPVFLIGDLHYKRRWYNMLRIFRPTSAMSIGSWTLTAFGTFSGLTAAGQLWEDLNGSPTGRRLSRVLGVPAGLAGAVMSIYTGVLLAATSTPLWASVYRLLPALFGASAASTAAAALSLTVKATGGSAEEERALDRFALAAASTELVLATATREAWRREGLDEPVREEPISSALSLGAIGLGVVVPLAIHGVQALTGRRSRTASTVAALSTLVGGLLLRAVVVKGGNRSGRRPEDYFKLAQAPEGEGDRP